MDSVWAPLPSVSDSARHSAITAINSAIFLFSPAASLVCSACSMLSCALMIPSLLDSPTIDRTNPSAQEASGCKSGLSGLDGRVLSGARMRRFIDFQQPLAVDAGIDLR